jgi:hypothetical protein
MSKSTNHEADQTVKFHVSIKEWDDMYDENNKTFDNYQKKSLEKSLNGILNKELFSWRFKVYCMNKVKERNNLIARSHTEALSSSQRTLVSDNFLKIINLKNIHVNIIPMVLLAEFIIFLGMNIFDSDFDDIDNKLSNFFLRERKIIM